MKREFTTAMRVFGFFADVFDLSAISPKLIFKMLGNVLKKEMHGY